MIKISTNKKKVQELLTRGVEEIIEKTHLEKALMSGRKLRIKFGIDPTAPILHLGHLAPLRLLRRFQDAGHTVILLVGDFTARIGDPTGRVESRPRLDDAEINANMATYVNQASKILDIKYTEVRYNNEWLGKMSMFDLFQLLGKITYGQVMARRDFRERLARDEDFTFSEFMYPIYQGYDSVALRADVEVGGSDQKFNMLMGRRIQKRYDQEPQDIVTVSLLEGLDGIKKMSKSEKNYIAFNDEPGEMYGKIMSIPDAVVKKYFILCTDIDMDEIKRIIKGNPRDGKMRLARAIVALYHGAETGRKAEEAFVRTFQKHEIPSEISKIRIKDQALNIVDLLVKTKLASSKSEARRVAEQGGVRIEGQVVKDPTTIITITKNGVLVQKGKRHFVKAILV